MKESYGKRERVVTGVRKAESNNRKNNQGIVTIIDGKKQKVDDNEDFKESGKGGLMLMNYDNSESVEMVYTCFRTNKVLVNPLINWTDDDVWRCIRDNNLPINPLYECGWNRVGCVGCPVAGKHRAEEFARYPKYKDRMIWIADKIVNITKEKCRKKGVEYVGSSDGKGYFKRWMEDDTIDGQLVLNPDGTITEYEV